MKQHRENQFPFYFTIDISSKCNLKCVYCPQGQGSHTQPVHFMPLETFKVFTTDILKNAKSICLSNWTEPFLHPELAEIVQYIKSVNPETYVLFSSNGSSGKISESAISKLIDCRLDRLEISISGLDQETYARYHKGGRLDNVANTLKRIANAKKNGHSQLPQVCINYLVFPYNIVSKSQIYNWLNQHFEDNALIKMIDEVRPIRGTILGQLKNGKEVMNDFRELWNSKILKLHFRPRCHFAFKHLVMRADGIVFPCCVVQYDDRHALGDLRKDSLPTIWDQGSWFREGFEDGRNRLCTECAFYNGILPVVNRVSMALNLRLALQLILQIFYKVDKVLLKGIFFRKLWIKYLKR